MLKPNQDYGQVHIEYRRVGTVTITASVPGSSDSATINVSCGTKTCVRCANDTTRGICAYADQSVCCDGATIKWGSAVDCSTSPPVSDLEFRCP